MIRCKGGWTALMRLAFLCLTELNERHVTHLRYGVRGFAHHNGGNTRTVLETEKFDSKPAGRRTEGHSWAPNTINDVYTTGRRFLPHS
jgi:hypothetical protein